MKFTLAVNFMPVEEGEIDKNYGKIYLTFGLS